MTAVDRAPRVALVTGGARGIGAAVAVALAGTGHDLAICDVCQPVEGMAYAMSGREELDGVAAEIVGLGRRCHAGAVDVRDLDAVERFVADTEAELGPITTVCANAGLSSPARPFWETAPEQWQTVLDVNLTGVWHVARAAAPAMIARGHGSIVVVASTNGRQAAGGGAGYTASKHGVLGLAKAMALELAPHGIRCNTVLPGRTETPLVGTAHGGVPRPTDRRYTALRGVGLLPPHSIAAAVCWLAGEGAAHVTGIEVVVDAGGHLLRGLNPEHLDAPPEPETRGNNR